MSHTVTICAATMDDLPTLNQLMFELHDEHHQACPKYFKTAVEIEQEKSIARYLVHPECFVFVAKQSEVIIGFITGHSCELISIVSQPILMGSLDELYVIPAYRQQHVAQALVARLEQVLRNCGAKELFVETWAFNQTALSFYQQQGFVDHIHWLRKPLF